MLVTCVGGQVHEAALHARVSGGTVRDRSLPASQALSGQQRQPGVTASAQEGAAAAAAH